MTTEVKIYPFDQMERLVEFKRAEAINGFLTRNYTQLLDGVKIIFRDEVRGDTMLIDMCYARMFRGALAGMFNECFDLGLGKEIIDGKRT